MLTTTIRRWIYWWSILFILLIFTYMHALIRVRSWSPYDRTSRPPLYKIMPFLPTGTNFHHHADGTLIFHWLKNYRSNLNINWYYFNVTINILYASNQLIIALSYCLLLCLWLFYIFISSCCCSYEETYRVSTVSQWPRMSRAPPLGGYFTARHVYTCHVTHW